MIAATIFVLGLALFSPGHAKSPDYQLPGAPPNSRVVVNRRQCWNSAAFVVTGALEIAMERLTGEDAVKLSEQEIVDCHWSGCDEKTAPTISNILHWLRIQQRLAPDAGYPDFNSKMDNDGNTCRAATSPNGLGLEIGENLEAVDDITLTMEDALEKYGSVTARINIEPEFCPGYLKLRKEIIEDMTKEEYMHIYLDKDDDGYFDGYTQWFTGENEHVIRGGEPPSTVNHYVLIVGIYEEAGVEYYIVRDSRGSAWMRRGHFLIERYTNTCGIETSRFAVVTSLKADAALGCPAALPKYCEETRTCTQENQACVEQEKGTYNPETDAPVREKDLPDVSGRPECEDTPGYAAQCAESAQSWKNCMSPSVQAICAGSCLMCHRDECKDVESAEGECMKYKRYCFLSSVRAMCAKTCQMHPMDCGTLWENVDLLTGKTQTLQGACYPPEIANGAVTAGADGMIASGAKLEVTCDLGYTLVGEENHCVIQNSFGPDSRLLQQCVLLGDETWTGTGLDYAGTKTTTTAGTGCINTREAAARGIFDKALDVTFGRAALQGGNHNHCRNTGGVGYAPWCLTTHINPDIFKYTDVEYGEGVDEDSEIVVTAAQLNYCEELPRCGGGFCEMQDFDMLDLCSLFGTGECYLTTPLAGNANWEFCPNYCCAEAVGCVETPVYVPSFDWDDFGDFK